MKICIEILITTLPNKEAKKRFKENINRIADDLIELEWHNEKRRKTENEYISINKSYNDYNM